MGDDSQDSNTLGTLKCGIVDCTSLKIGGTDFPANAASNSNQQILPANPEKGDMLFWNGSKWGLVKSESGSEGDLLTLINGSPVWKSYEEEEEEEAEEEYASAAAAGNATTGLNDLATASSIMANGVGVIAIGAGAQALGYS